MEPCQAKSRPRLQGRLLLKWSALTVSDQSSRARSCLGAPTAGSPLPRKFNEREPREQRLEGAPNGRQHATWTTQTLSLLALGDYLGVRCGLTRPNATPARMDCSFGQLGGRKKEPKFPLAASDRSLEEKVQHSNPCLFCVCFAVLYNAFHRGIGAAQSGCT
ncbi:hypothetical protein F5884DRAFT_394467 [Xylogone sp. PMI_703]|nr:hypothetical protein F5884DRAFT_394467 [Xylogone sp. PMI_703]